MNPSEPLAVRDLLARNLKHLREQRGLTALQVSQLSGIAPKRLEAIEASAAAARLNELTLFALVLGVRVAALFADE